MKLEDNHSFTHLYKHGMYDSNKYNIIRIFQSKKNDLNAHTYI
jgi:hypothetical protein